ncbi:probable insulin-like peptide 7 isoform X2 [Littorina saxatilis]|uniref:probable insulin-like peptide 7 isoform X2 n=1 Tax=Littorina saxatilis TaxID=31220 RepID=UPI0038B556A6
MCKNEPVTWRIAATSSACLALFLAVLMVSFHPHATQATGLTEGEVLNAFAERFQQSSGEEIYDLWHGDCHRRCRNQLRGHVSLACRFDPYKLTKRSLTKRSLTKRSLTSLTKRDVNSTIQHINKSSQPSHTSSLFLTKTTAATFFAGTPKGKSPTAHRRKKRGIMQECCYSKSCSWEEYAEFCHTHNRRPAVRDSLCFP